MDLWMDDDDYFGIYDIIQWILGQTPKLKSSPRYFYLCKNAPTTYYIECYFGGREKKKWKK